MSIQSVKRASQVLGLFTKAKPRLGSTEISKALGIHKATAQGLVRTLLEEELLCQDPETKKYYLGLKIYELGMVLAGSLEINQKASTLAHQLAVKLNLLVRVSIPYKNDAIVTLDAFPQAQPFYSQHLGVRFPLYCTSMGKAILAYLNDEEINNYLDITELYGYTPNTITRKDDLLAELETIRKIGYSVNREEHLLSRASIGASIFGAHNRVVGSTCIVGHPDRILGDEMKQIAQKITIMALEVSQAMGYFPNPTPSGAT